MKEINKQVLRGIIRESLQGLMTEGAGAGYDVTFEGLKATDIRITGTEVKQNLHSTDKIVKFTASLAPSIVEWKAIGYYEGVTSEGIYYDNDLVDEFDDLQKTVNGGSISGWVYYEDVNNSAPTWETESATEEDVVRFINDWLSDFSFTTMYGSGWSHVNLTDPMIFKNIEIKDNYHVTYVYINTIEISAPEITKTINWYFDNYLDFGKIYGGEEEMDETLEQEPLQENKKQTIKLKESQLRKIICESVKKVLGKSWQNSADEWV